MSSGCSAETLRDNLTLKLESGEWLDNSYRRLTAVLKSKDNEEVLAFPTRICYFDKLDDLQCYSAGGYSPHSLGKDMHLEVFKAINNEFRFHFLDKDGRTVDADFLMAKDVIVQDNVNLEKYLEQKILIKPVGLERNGYRAAALYDTDGNEIGKLAEELLYYNGSFLYTSIDSLTSAHVYDNSYFYVTIDRIDDKFHIINDQVNNEVQNVKVSNKYKLSVINNSSDTDINVPNIDIKNIKYSILNKIIEENDTCYQLEILKEEKEKLCKELDDIRTASFMCIRTSKSKFCYRACNI